MTLHIPFKLLSSTAIVPQKAHDTDAGFDVFANETITIHPNQTYLVRTGFSCDTPANYYLRLVSRSGNESKARFHVIEGTIDSHYQGEIKVIIEAKHNKPYTIARGERIAQLIPTQLIPTTFVDEPFTTLGERQQNGFGSTGK